MPGAGRAQWEAATTASTEGSGYSSLHSDGDETQIAPHPVSKGRAAAASTGLPRKDGAAPANAAPELQGWGRQGLHPGSAEITAPGDAFTSRSGGSCLSLQSPCRNRQSHPNSTFLPCPAPQREETPGLPRSWARGAKSRSSPFAPPMSGGRVLSLPRVLSTT